MSGTIAIVLFCLGLLLAIVLHEAGHFLTARRFGIRADRFFVGFGPTLWSTQRGETEYGVKALPLGGFVRIRGMGDADARRAPLPNEAFDLALVAADVEGTPEPTGTATAATAVPTATWDRLERTLLERGTPRETADRIVRRTRQNAGPDADVATARGALTEVLAGELPASQRLGDLTHRLTRGDEDRFFSDKPAWQRAIVLSAGSAVHFAIALVLLLGVQLFVPVVVGFDPVVSEVIEDSPAEAGGLQVGDRVLAVEGEASTDYGQLRELIQQRPDEPTDLRIDRGGEELTLTLTPSAVTNEETGETVGQVGFAPTALTERLPVDEAIAEAITGEAGFVAQFTGTFRALGAVFGPEGLGNLFSQATGGADRDAEGAVSIVGAANVAGQAAAFGIAPLLLLTAAINIFIGIFNLLPLPPLDGGHLAVLGIERSVNAVRGVRGKPQDFTVDPRAVVAVAVPVLTVLGFVFVSLLWLDITSPIQLPF